MAETESIKSKQETVHDQVDRLIKMADTTVLEQMKSNIETKVAAELEELLLRYSDGGELNPEEAAHYKHLGAVADRLEKVNQELQSRKGEVTEAGEVKQETVVQESVNQARTDAVGEKTLHQMNALRREQGAREYENFSDLYDEAKMEDNARERLREYKEEKEYEADAKKQEEFRKLEEEKQDSPEYIRTEQVQQKLGENLKKVDKFIINLSEKKDKLDRAGLWERGTHFVERAKIRRKLERVNTLREELIQAEEGYLRKSGALSEKLAMYYETAPISEIELLDCAFSVDRLTQASRQEFLDNIEAGLDELKKEHDAVVAEIFDDLRKEGIEVTPGEREAPEINVSTDPQPDRGSREEQRFYLDQLNNIEGEVTYASLRSKLEAAMDFDKFEEEEARKYLEEYKKKNLAMRMRIKRYQDKIVEESKKPSQERNMSTVIYYQKAIRDEAVKLNHYRDNIIYKCRGEGAIARIKRRIVKGY